MTGNTHRRFAYTLLTLIPDFPLNTKEIQTAIRTKGIEGFIQSAGEKANELAEISRLLSQVNNNGTSRKSDGAAVGPSDAQLVAGGSSHEPS